MIHIGDTADGERVSIPVHHSAIFGMTGVGKTRLIKFMMAQAVAQGYRIVVFDSKLSGEEFDGIGFVAPFYLEESTDPDVLMSLLESIRDKKRGKMASLERFRGGFIEVCEGTSTFADVEKNLLAKLADKKNIKGQTRLMYRSILYDFAKLKKILGSFSFSPVFLAEAYFSKSNIIRIPTTRLPSLAIQGMVVASVVDKILRDTELSRIIFVVDEAPNFVNQHHFNPAKPSLQELDAQGRSAGKFAWYSGQTITGIDKASLKNTWYWVMGREGEGNEIADVYDSQSHTVLSKQEIKRMKVREFLVSAPDYTKLVTVPEVEETPNELVVTFDGGAPKRTKVAEDIELAAGRGPKNSAQGEPATPLRERVSENGAVLTSGHSTKAPLNAPPLTLNTTIRTIGAGEPTEHPSHSNTHGRIDRGEADRGVATFDESADSASGIDNEALESKGTPTPRSSPEIIDLEEKRLVLNITHSEKVIDLTTDELKGQVVFILMQSERPLSLPDVVQRAAEYGWPISYEVMRKNFNRDFVDKGLVVKDGGLYRLPRFVKFEVKRSVEAVVR